MKVLLVVLFLVVVLTSGFELKYDNKVEVPKAQLRITNGISAYGGQFKYQVGLVVKKGQFETLCGGTLIAPGWILTAAHCIQGASRVYAFLGSTKFLSGTLVIINQAILHHQWNPETTANDICLLRFSPFNMGPNIAPVNLPPLNGYYNSYVNENVIASGWGTTSDHDRKPSDELQYARLRIVPNSVCSRRYAIFRDANICTQGQSGTSTCKGDSGGPLVTEYGVLVGITSFGAAAGCTQNFPGAFTRVSSYRSWIKDITRV